MNRQQKIETLKALATRQMSVEDLQPKTFRLLMLREGASDQTDDDYKCFINERLVTIDAYKRAMEEENKADRNYECEIGMIRFDDPTKTIRWL